MKHIILGDTHGRGVWKDIVNVEQADKVVFIGDYFDSFNIDAEAQMNNFKDICAYKEANMDKVVMLIGNHDFHYIVNGLGERYSGFQKAFQFSIQHLLNDALNKNFMQMAYLYQNILCTHAGVTKTWLATQEEWDHTREDAHVLKAIIELPIDQYINSVWTRRKMAFKFSGLDQSNCGEHKSQSPIWVRPPSLYVDRLDVYTQVIGHTPVNNITEPKYVPGFWMIDALETKPQVLIVEENKIEAKLIEFAL